MKNDSDWIRINPQSFNSEESAVSPSSSLSSRNAESSKSTPAGICPRWMYHSIPEKNPCCHCAFAEVPPHLPTFFSKARHGMFCAGFPSHGQYSAQQSPLWEYHSHPQHPKAPSISISHHFTKTSQKSTPIHMLISYPKLFSFSSHLIL